MDSMQDKQGDPVPQRAGRGRQRPSACFDEEALEESEPYLGPAWALAMVVLYLLKRAFPAEEYSFLWWVQVYVIGVVVAVTVFTLVKRHQFYKLERSRQPKQKADPGNCSPGS
jgi:hypothetical protein